MKEFRSCIDQLNSRDATPGLSKYIVLVYVDPTDGTRKSRYSNFYDEYCHPDCNVALRVVESSGPVETKEGIVRAQLYQVGCGSSAESGAAPTGA